MQIDIHELRESYEHGELARIGWIPGGSNPADALTKSNVSKDSPLMNMIISNKLTLRPEGWATMRQPPGGKTPTTARAEEQITTTARSKGPISTRNEELNADITQENREEDEQISETKNGETQPTTSETQNTEVKKQDNSKNDHAYKRIRHRFKKRTNEERLGNNHGRRAKGSSEDSAPGRKQTGNKYITIDIEKETAECQ